MTYDVIIMRANGQKHKTVKTGLTFDSACDLIDKLETYHDNNGMVVPIYVINEVPKS